MAEVAQTGNYSQVSTWVGGLKPTENEAVLIPESLTLTIDENAEFGATTINGTLVKNEDINVVVNGNMLVMGTGILTVNAGGYLNFDGNYALTWYSGSQINVNGTSVKPVSIGATAGNTLTYSAYDNETQTKHNINYCQFSNTGTVNITGRSASYTQNVEYTNCLFVNYGMIWIYQGETPSVSSTLKFIDCDFRNPQNAEHSIYLSKSFEVAENSHAITGCTFYGSSVKYLTTKLTSTNKFILTNNKIGNLRLDITGTDCQNNYFYSGLSQAEVINNNGSSIISGNVFYSTGYNNPHHIQLVGNATVENNISIMDTENGDGNHILVTEADGVVATVNKNLTIGDNGIIARGTRPNCDITITRHSHLSSNDGLSDDLLIVEDPDYTGLITLKSSLCVSTTGGALAGDPESSETELIAGCEFDYNNIYNTALASRYAVPIDGKTLGDAGYGQNDLGVDPEFVNPNATILTCDTNLGGDGSLLNFNTKMFSINGYDLTGGSATPDTNYTINNVKSYFVNAFTPTAVELSGAGELGVDIGAIDVQAGFEVTFSVVGSGTTTPSGTNVYSDGEIVEIEAIADNGSIFMGWSADGDIDFDDPYNALTNATINGQGTILAEFDLQNYISTIVIEEI